MTCCQFGLFLYNPEHQIKKIPMYVVINVVNRILHSLVKHIAYIFDFLFCCKQFTLVLNEFLESA